VTNNTARAEAVRREPIDVSALRRFPYFLTAVDRRENDARAEIVKNWRSYPAGGRQRCINTTGYMPSYVEWLTCLEMEQSVEALRKNNPATNPAATEGRGKR
jgi:hypothetical protein